MTPDPATRGDSLPEPTGPHSVGRVSYDWVDRARTEIYAANPEDRRELVVFVWYPAKPQASVELAAYMPPVWAPAVEFLGLDVAGMRVFRHLLLQIGGANIENPPPSSSLAPDRAPPCCGGASRHALRRRATTR
jgi:hypothetical protein